MRKPPEHLIVAKGERDGAPSVHAVRVHLERTSDGARLSVVAAHLASGDGAKEEAERLAQLDKSGLQAWVAESLAAAGGDGGDAGALLFCLDANSSPDRPDRYDGPTTWKQLRGMPGMASVWDAYFDRDGTPCHPSGLVPATTNKVRGPQTQQAKKLGQQFKGAIDHIYFHGLGHTGFAWGPVAFGSSAEALNHLLPSLLVPSDHFPVCADFILPPRREPSLLAAARRALRNHVLPALRQPVVLAVAATTVGAVVVARAK